MERVGIYLTLWETSVSFILFMIISISRLILSKIRLSGKSTHDKTDGKGNNRKIHKTDSAIHTMTFYASKKELMAV